jgi:type IV secretory pathway TraG/TraD family ATPase VirD4
MPPAATASVWFACYKLVRRSMYLALPPSEKIRLRRLIRLMFTMVVSRLTERMAFDGSEQKRSVTTRYLPFWYS